MALQNASISVENLTGQLGTTSAAGSVNLTVTPAFGYQIQALFVGNATQDPNNPGTWLGGNVTSGIDKVKFTALPNGSWNAEVFYSAIDWSSATDLYVDIDGKTRAISVEPEEPEQEVDCCERFEDEVEAFQTDAYNALSIINPSTAQAYDGSITVPMEWLGASAQFSSQSSDCEQLSILAQVNNTTTGAQVAPGSNTSTQDYIISNLQAGDYYLTLTDTNEDACGPQRIFFSLSPNSSTPHSVNSAKIGGEYFNGEMLPIAQSQEVVISHGKEADFLFEVQDKGTGSWYDFDKQAFTKGRTYFEVKYPGSFVTRKTIHFPSTSATAAYEYIVTPRGRTSVNESVPTAENPKRIMQRVDNTITLTMSSDSNSDNWTSIGTKTITGRPHTQPKPRKINPNLPGYTTAP